MSDICILCRKFTVKINEKHRVEGRGAFKILPEIESLPFPVERASPFICVVCVNKLKKRRNLIRQVNEIEQYYKAIHNISTKSSLKRINDVVLDDPGVKIQRSNNSESLSNVPAATPTTYTCSSPSRVSRVPDINTTQWPLSPIQPSIQPTEPPKTTSVTVKVQWPSKDAERKLSADLESLGKMLLPGTYKQIAHAAWRNIQLKKQLQLLMLKQINTECSHLCSKKNPSCLRSPSKENILKFSMEGLNKELKERAPLTFATLVAASTNPRSKAQLKEKFVVENFWSPAIGMAAAVCLKNRSKFMNALQLLITMFNYHSGWQVSLIKYRTNIYCSI